MASPRATTETLQTIESKVGKIDGYTNMQGWDQARKALSVKFRTKSYSLNQNDIFLCSGGSLAIWSAMMILAQDGDNFLFPSPGFPLGLSYAKFMNVEPRFYTLQPLDRWNVRVQQMESLIDQKTRFIYINDPSNPLGSCWSADQKKVIIDLARRHNIPIIADQIYQGMTYNEDIGTFAECSTEDVTIFKCSGLTKRWLGPGWRLGWLIVYASEAKKRIYLPSLRGVFNILLMPNTVVQAAIPEIIALPVNELNMKRCLDLMQINQEYLKDGLEGEPYCSFGHSQGALYATIILDLLQLKGFASDVEFAKQLYAQQNVVVFPGNFFTGGETPFIRLVISTSIDIIKVFLDRFKRFCKKHLENH